ncbi:phage terminase small subunit P27 family [Bradyrhizobium sp. UFLA05-153]
MPGPTPEHPHLRLLKGNPGKRRARVPPEAQSANVCPEPPKQLSDRAKKEWRAIAPELHRLGLLTVLDVGPFAAYCSAMAHWRTAEEAIGRLDSLTITTKSGQRMHPLVRIASQAANDALKFGAHFGLSPISRLRLSGMEPPKPPSKFDGLIA